MAKTEEQIIGEDFEDEIKDVLSNIQSKHPLFFHRFPDSKAARGFIAAQPSDFLVGYDGDAFLLEAKASGKYSTLQQCAKKAIKPSQIGMSKKWNRAGLTSLFVFYSVNENKVEVWDGKYVADCISENDKLNLLSEHLLGTFDYFKLEENLLALFKKGISNE